VCGDLRLLLVSRVDDQSGGRRDYRPFLRSPRTAAPSSPVTRPCPPGRRFGGSLRGGVECLAPGAHVHQTLVLRRQKVPDGSATAKAIDYSFERRPALTRFLDGGERPKE
jgi:hypothetical protein